MGSGPSREDIQKDTEFAMKVQAQQRQIQAQSISEISAFFATVDSMVSTSGAIANDDITKAEQANTKEMEKVENTKDQAAGIKPTAVSNPPQDLPDTKFVSYTPKPDVLVLMNVASVMYKQTSSSEPIILKGLVDTVESTILDLLGQSGSGGKGKEGAAKENGAQVPTTLTNALTTLFAVPTAIKSVTEGVASVAKLLLSSMEGNLAVSSSLIKKIQFVAPGCYCATYYSTSKFSYKGGGFNTKTFDYELSCGGMYLVTSAKLVQVVASLTMYRQITESFTKRLKEVEDNLLQFTGALSDSAFFGTMFGFSNEDKDDICKNLKTQVMKLIVNNFWNATKSKSDEDRVNKWNSWIGSGDVLGGKITSTQRAYDSAYQDLKQYYNDFVLNPPIPQK